MILIMNYKVHWKHFNLSSFKAFFSYQYNLCVTFFSLISDEEYMKHPQPQPIEDVSMLMIKVFIEGNFS